MKHPVHYADPPRLVSIDGGRTVWAVAECGVGLTVDIPHTHLAEEVTCLDCMAWALRRAFPTLPIERLDGE